MTRFECPHCEKNCAEKLAELQRCIVELAAGLRFCAQPPAHETAAIIIGAHAETIKQAQDAVKKEG